ASSTRKVRTGSQKDCGACSPGHRWPAGTFWCGRACGVGSASDRRRLGGVTDLGYRGDQVTYGDLLWVVCDQDASGGELHLRILHAVQTIQLVFDLGDTARTGELIRAQGGVLQRGGGGHRNQVLSCFIVMFLCLYL